VVTQARELAVKLVKWFARAVPLDLAFSLLRVLPRSVTAKLVASVDFKSEYHVDILGLKFKMYSGPLDDHFLDLEHNGLIDWEDKTLKVWSELSSKAEVCIDVGAYLGVYSIISSLSGAREVFAIEPNPNVYTEMVANFTRNALEEKISCLNVAVGESEFKGSLLAMPNRPLSSGAHLDLGSRENIVYESGFRRYQSNAISQVVVKPLDFILRITNSKIDLVKIDVEGYELLVLDGATQILREHKPVLIIEIVSEKQKDIIDRKLRTFDYGIGQLILDARESRNYIFKHNPQN